MTKEEKIELRMRLRWTTLEEGNLILGMVVGYMLKDEKRDFWDALKEAIQETQLLLHKTL